MPEPVEPPPLTAKQKREWRDEFEGLGPAAVRHQLNSGGIPLEWGHKREAAAQWLREKERVTEWREQWTFWIAVAILVLTIIGIALDASGLLGSSGQ